jgi:hypothetical protein
LAFKGRSRANTLSPSHGEAEVVAHGTAAHARQHHGGKGHIDHSPAPDPEHRLLSGREAGVAAAARHLTTATVAASTWTATADAARRTGRRHAGVVWSE